MPNMAIELNLNERPLKAIPSPYGQCTKCKYVYEGISIEKKCPGCGLQQLYPNPWPEDQLLELWNEQIDLWNRERVELAVIVAAMYFESSVFQLLYLGNIWLDPELNWLDTSTEEQPRKTEAIWSHLIRIHSFKDTKKEIRRLFKASFRDMLQAVLGDDGEYYWTCYRGLTVQRNHIIHRGRRSTVRDDSGKILWAQPEVPLQLNWCLKWIPHCWAVFSKLHNKYIHRHMLERAKDMASS